MSESSTTSKPVYRLFSRAEAATFLKDRGEPPPWRKLRHRDGLSKASFRGSTHVTGERERQAVDAALRLRRPLLITGAPGVGKSSLAYAVAEELGLGEVFVWPISSRTTLQQGLYSYDALARLEKITREKERDAKPQDRDEEIGRYLTLGPLGSALCASTPDRPRVLLIDELDKSDIDLPNDLLHVLEEGAFVIPELKRLEIETVKVPLFSHEAKVSIEKGEVVAEAAPFILITSNGEREFPPAFLRRCLRLEIEQPRGERLRQIVLEKLKGERLPDDEALTTLLKEFEDRLNQNTALSTDQVLNAAFLLARQELSPSDQEQLKLLFQPLQ